jgi:3',5'-cyclic AMP phosphodiesterase CpdA
MKFIHLTDTHLVAPGEPLHGLDPHANLLACVAAIRARHADAEFCVLTGDLVDNGDPRAYRAASEAIAALPMPVYVIPGNHDDRVALHESFANTRCDEHGFVQQVIDHGEARFMLLDTLEPQQGSAGAYCERRASWLAARLAEAGDAPVYLFMHHPPFPIGIPSMDRIGLLDPQHFVRAIDGARNLRHIFFGHVHRPVSGHWRGISFSTLHGTNHQVLLDLHEPRYIAFTAEPPSYAVVLLEGDRLVIHNEPFLADLRDIRTTAPRA